MKSTLPRPVRLKDIAKRAEISISAVSMALADHPDIGPETKRQVRELSERLGYRRAALKTAAARQEREGELRRIGFLQVGGRSDDRVHSPPLRSLARHANGLGMRLEIHDIEEAEDVDTVIRHAVQFAEGVDGLVVTGRASPNVFAALDELKIPCVTLGHVMSDPTDPDPSAHLGHVVSHDEILAGRMATKRLIAAGHWRIAFTCERTPPGLSHSRWLSGYQLAHLDMGLPIDSELITVTGRPFWGADQAAERYLGMRQPPTAHIVPDVRIAHGLIRAYADRGAAIAQAAIVIDGLPEVAKLFAMEDYPLIYCDTDLLARAVLERLRELHEHPQPQPTTLLVPFILHNLP
jgi:DNA-binding LacI/PurR family transcriptional regulator